MTHVPRRFCGQITYIDHKQAYIFKENDVAVSIENSIYVIHHDPVKQALDMIKYILTN